MSRLPCVSIFLILLIQGKGILLSEGASPPDEPIPSLADGDGDGGRTNAQLLTSVLTKSSQPSEEFNGNHPTWNADKWVEIWERSLKSQTQNQSSESERHEGNSTFINPLTLGERHTKENKTSPTKSPIISSTKSSSNLNDELREEHPEWNLDKWVELWERASKDESEDSVSQSGSLFQNSRSTDHSEEKSTDKTTVVNPATVSSVTLPDLDVQDPLAISTAHSTGIETGTIYREEFDEGRPSNRSPEEQQSDHILLGNADFSPESLTDKDVTMSSRNPVLPSASISSDLNKDMSIDHPDWDLDMWVKVWEHAVKDRDSNNGKGSSIILGKTLTNGAIHSAHTSTSSTLKTKDNAIITGRTFGLPEKVPTDGTYSTISSASSTSRTTDKTVKPGRVVAVTEKTAIVSGKHTSKDNQNEDRQIYPETTRSISTKQMEDSTAVEQEQLSEITKEYANAKEAIFFSTTSKIDADTEESHETKSIERDIKPILTGNLQGQPLLTLIQEPEENLKQTDESKERFEDNDVLGLDYKTFIIVFSLSVVVVALIVSLIVCIYCKKQKLGLSWKMKQLTTMNSDVNRFDLQILRPNKNSLNAFVFGPPIPTIDEKLRAVVVDYPELRY